MPKKKTQPAKSIKLDFTGKMSILIDLKEYGPMEYRIDDIDVCLKVMQLLLKETGPTTTVNSYNKRTENAFRKILDF